MCPQIASAPSTLSVFQSIWTLAASIVISKRSLVLRDWSGGSSASSEEESGDAAVGEHKRGSIVILLQQPVSESDDARVAVPWCQLSCQRSLDDGNLEKTPRAKLLALDCLLGTDLDGSGSSDSDFG